jgi:hypothetical protein
MEQVLTGLFHRSKSRFERNCERNGSYQVRVSKIFRNFAIYWRSFWCDVMATSFCHATFLKPGNSRI